MGTLTSPFSKSGRKFFPLTTLTLSAFFSARRPCFWSRMARSVMCENICLNKNTQSQNKMSKTTTKTTTVRDGPEGKNSTLAKANSIQASSDSSFSRNGFYRTFKNTNQNSPAQIYFNIKTEKSEKNENFKKCFALERPFFQHLYTYI